MAKQSLSGAEIDLFGTTVELWMETAKGFAPFRQIAGNAADYIESVSVKIGLMEVFNLEVKLCPPLQDAVNLINTGKIGIGFSKSSSDSTKKVAGGGNAGSGSGSKFSLNRMAVRISSGGLSSPIFKAILLMPNVEVGQEGIDITMKGVGMLFESTKTPARLDGQMKPSEAIQKWLGDGDRVKVVFKDDAKKILDDGQVIAPETKSAYEAAQALLKEKNCRMYYAGSSTIKGSQVVYVVHDSERRKLNDVAATFVAFKQINPNKRVFPILDFSCPINNLLIMSAINGAKSSVVDKASKDVSQQNAGAETYRTKASPVITSQDGGMGGGADAGNRDSTGEPSGMSDTDGVGTIMGHISREFSNGADVIQGVVHDWMNKVFQYSLSSILVPDLLPGRMVNVQVADIRSLTGSYDLKSVEMVVTNSGAESKLEVVAMGGMVAGAGRGLNVAAGKVVDAAQKLTSKVSTTKGTL